jgi:hypothetical protein
MTKDYPILPDSALVVDIAFICIPSDELAKPPGSSIAPEAAFRA